MGSAGGPVPTRRSLRAHPRKLVADDLATAVSSPLHSRRGSGYRFELKKHQTHERRIVSTPAPNTPPPGDAEHHLDNDMGNNPDREQEGPEPRLETETETADRSEEQ